MVEELKILAEIFKGLTNGALYGVIAYLLIDLMKIVAIAGFSFLGVRTVVVNMFKPNVEVKDANK